MNIGSFTIEFVNGVGTERDRPAELAQAAIRDLAVLAEVLGCEVPAPSVRSAGNDA
jgi:hypothetical protein